MTDANEHAKAAQKGLAEAQEPLRHVPQFRAYLEPNGPTVHIEDAEHLDQLLKTFADLRAATWFHSLVRFNEYSVVEAADAESCTGYQVACVHNGIAYVLQDIAEETAAEAEEDDLGMPITGLPDLRISYEEQRAKADEKFRQTHGAPEDLAKTIVQKILEAVPDSRVDIHPHQARDFLPTGAEPELDYGDYYRAYQKALRSGLETELKQRRKRLIQDLAARYITFCRDNGVDRPTQVSIKMWLTDHDIQGNDTTVREIRAILTQKGMR